MATLVRPTSWRDWAVPTALLVWAQWELWILHPPVDLAPRLGFSAIAVGCCLALTVRRAHPVAAMLAVSSLLLLPLAFGWFLQSGAQILMMVVAVFSCGRYAARPSAYLAIPVLSLMVLIESGVDPEHTLSESWLWSLNSLWIFGLGAAFRHERLLREQVASASEVKAQATAAQERLRIARELHDVLSHSLSVIVVQAEVADTYFDRDPPRSRQAVGRVASTGRAAMNDTRRLVGLLRDSDADTPTSALPGLADIPALIDRARDSGLPVALDVGTDLPPLTTESTVTAYRVVQESLTNVLRHAGPVRTQVGLRPAPGALVIDIHNVGNGQTPTPRPGGHGLIGNEGASFVLRR